MQFLEDAKLQNLVQKTAINKLKHISDLYVMALGNIDKSRGIDVYNRGFKEAVAFSQKIAQYTEKHKVEPNVYFTAKKNCLLVPDHFYFFGQIEEILTRFNGSYKAKL